MLGKENLKLKDSAKIGIGLGLIAWDLMEPGQAYAALPWEGPLEQLQYSLTGPVAKAVCAITVCCSGFFVACGEGGQFGRLCGRLVLGLSLSVGFMQIISMF